MYKGYNITPIDFPISPSDYNLGLSQVNEDREHIGLELKKFLRPNGSIDGAKLQHAWFPQIDADVFISHSHQDEIIAIGLAGWLNHHFDLRVFVDSTVWGFADQLLKTIDDTYCRRPTGASYSYEQRNRSTAHVHIMLTTALSQMVNSAECLFFLNTPNTTSTQEMIQAPQTHSPWLYYELGISNLLRKPLSEHNNRRTLLRKSKTFSLNESLRQLDVTYPLTTSHLVDIDGDDLVAWRNKYRYEFPTPDFALDTLYDTFS